MNKETKTINQKNPQDKQLELYGLNNKLLFWALGSCLFWVVFLWGFWNKGLTAFGMNATVYLLIYLGLFVYAARKYRGVNWEKYLNWLAPVFLIALSFSIFENPFLKATSFNFIPLIFWIFFSYTLLKEDLKSRWYWSFNFVMKLLAMNLVFFAHIGQALKVYFSLPKLFSGNKEKSKINDIILGLVIFLALAIIIVIPILASADQMFAEKIKAVSELIENVISWRLVGKFLFFSLFSIVTLSFVLSWIDKRRFQYFSWRKVLELDLKNNDQNKEQRQSGEQKTKFDQDSIIAGIVLGGVLLIYLLFLYTQLERFWMNDLPIDFKETEKIVKIGFWQLFFLSFINIIFYFLYYKKTKPWAQKILIAFTITSFLLLISAGQRMYLYVYYYGLSYEKFFASYTVLYILVFMIALTGFLFKEKRADIFKFLIFSCLWMYAVITIFPVELTIMRVNIALAQRSDSRIDLHWMKMLSSDVMPIVKQYRKDDEWRGEWAMWIKDQEAKIKDKKWYEKNFMNIFYNKVSKHQNSSRE
ncbi:MAG: DUF4173 domain-containing protein [Candidatus Moranbacteria bacterium]|nr:DUF4173 domain-containing protein [Candidatus Moranbacteria bacterium]